MPSTMQEKINDLLMKELSGFFDKLILDMETENESEGFTRDTIMKSAEEYFKTGTSKPKTVKSKVTKEKKSMDQAEQCIAIKKDGVQCSKKKTNKMEYSGTELENLCTSHITIHIKNAQKEDKQEMSTSSVDEIDPPFETSEEKIEEPKKKTKKSKKEIIEEDEL